MAHDGLLDQGRQQVRLHQLHVVVFRGPVEVGVGDKEHLAGGLVFQHGDDGDGVSDVQAGPCVCRLVDDGRVLEMVGEVNLLEVEQVELVSVEEDRHAVHHVGALGPVRRLGLSLEDGVVAQLLHRRLPRFAVHLVFHLLEAQDVGELGEVLEAPAEPAKPPAPVRVLQREIRVHAFPEIVSRQDVVRRHRHRSGRVLHGLHLHQLSVAQDCVSVRC